MITNPPFGEVSMTLVISKMAINKFVSLFSRQQNFNKKHNNEEEYIITEENLKDNTPKGKPMESKLDHHLRIWCANINGMRYDSTCGKLNEIIAVQKETDADIMSVTEHNTDVTQYEVTQNIYRRCKEKMSTPQVTYSTTPTTSYTTFKPGGTMLISQGPVTARIIKKNSDYLGRWSSQTYAGKKGIKVTIITCYQIPAKKDHTGKYTNQAQQEAHLRKTNRPYTNIRKLFYDELSAEVETLIGKEHDVL